MTSDNDQDLWRRFTENIKPLSSHKKQHMDTNPVNPYMEKTIVRKDGQTENVITHRPITVILQKDEVGYNHPLKEKTTLPIGTLNPSDFQKNKKIGATLDLHGQNQNMADRSLLHFFDRAQARGLKFVLVITGKGDPTHGVIKSFAQNWFKQHHEYVAAYCEALVKDGGSGAFYVHIRRIRSN